MVDTLTVIATKSDHLDDLAARARNEHHLVQAASANALAHALNAGDILVEAKSKVAKRAWKAWLGTCSIAASTARLYQQLSRHRAEIEAAICGGAELSLRGARQLISKPCPRRKASKREDTLEKLWRRSRAADRTAFLDEIGVDEILKFMSGDFGRDLRSRVPTPKPKHQRRKTLTLVAN
jgi:hypothetical protein